VGRCPRAVHVLVPARRQMEGWNDEKSAGEADRLLKVSAEEAARVRRSRRVDDVQVAWDGRTGHSRRPDAICRTGRDFPETRVGLRRAGGDA
jgi:hypothetical protein